MLLVVLEENWISLYISEDASAIVICHNVCHVVKVNAQCILLSYICFVYRGTECEVRYHESQQEHSLLPILLPLSDGFMGKT